MNEKVQTYMLRDAEDSLQAEVTPIGASLVSLEVKLADGSRRDVVLGYADPEMYRRNEPHLGATIAPFANRIGGATFSLSGKECRLEANDGANCLHGGSHALQDEPWEVREVSEESITFSAVNADGENGFPGPLHVEVTYTLRERALILDYLALAEQDTLFNPTNHSYFNLNGEGNGDCLGHRLQIFADRITPAGPGGVPDGAVCAVANTPFDFREPQEIGARIDAPDPVLRRTNGYDHNYVLNKSEDLHAAAYDTQGCAVHLAARAFAPDEAVTMEVYTDCPGLQVYTANFLSAEGTGKAGKSYAPRSAVCLETQYFPNAVNVPAFPQPVIRRGQEVHSRTVYRFV